jgi:hypothetical protein
LDQQQLDFVGTLNLAGVAALAIGCLAAGRATGPSWRASVSTMVVNSPRVQKAGFLIGGVGFSLWAWSIVNVGGFTGAFGRSYGGGWSGSGYVRDAMLLLIPALLMLMPRMLRKPWSVELKLAVGLFAMPLVLQGLLGARRGPTFMIATVIALAWYLYRGRRPPLLAVAAGGAALGFLVLFLVTNRGNIYLGSKEQLQLNGTEYLAGGGGGNEFIYGAGSILHAQRTNHFYWGRRYLAQVLIRPIPRQLWPNKYADFGVPELEANAGTGGAQLRETLSWEGAPGAAPGIVADLWLEFWWFAVPVLGGIGWVYGQCWKKAVVDGGPWVMQYIILAALSLYLVMQTMEAVIFRLLILSIPVWLMWRTVRKRGGRRRALPAVAPRTRMRTTAYRAAR